MRSAWVLAIAIGVLLLTSLQAGATRDGPRASGTPHAPILIIGDSQFTAANGVTGGFGTSVSPYVISNWSISVPTGTGVEVRNTTAPFVLRDLEVVNPAPSPSNTPIAIFLKNVSSATIEAFSLVNVSVGIVAHEVRDLAVRSGNIQIVNSSAGLQGMTLYRGAEVTVAGVSFSRGRGAIRIDTVSNMSLDGCAFQGDMTVSVTVWSSKDITLRDNRIEYAYQGFTVVNSSYVHLISNRVTGGSYSVYFDASDNGTVVGNQFIGPVHEGIVFDVDSRFPGRSLRDFALYHNNFVNATVDIGSPLTSSVWDDGYPSGGNYWSAFRVNDTCRGANQTDCSNRDGIGDAPYRQGGPGDPFGLLDRYPFVRPYPLPAFPPIARLVAGASRTTTDSAITFNGSASSDASDPTDLLQFRWDWTGDGSWDTLWVNDSRAVHQFAVSGTFAVRMQVRNTAGLTSQAEVTVTVDVPSWNLWLPVGVGVVLAGIAAVALLRRRHRKRMKGDRPPP